MQLCVCATAHLLQPYHSSPLPSPLPPPPYPLQVESALAAAGRGAVKLLYVAPEKLLTPWLLAAIRGLTISLVGGVGGGRWGADGGVGKETGNTRPGAQQGVCCALRRQRRAVAVTHTHTYTHTWTRLPRLPPTRPAPPRLLWTRRTVWRSGVTPSGLHTCGEGLGAGGGGLYIPAQTKPKPTKTRVGGGKGRCFLDHLRSEDVGTVYGAGGQVRG